MRFFPERLRIRLITNSPPASKPSSFSLISSGGGRSSNSASTFASSSLWRMMSEAPRSPQIKPSALRTIDLPAPVSPVRTLSPGPSSSATSSITAKFLIRSSRSIQAGLTFSPLQFVAQDFIIAARRQLDQRDRQTKIPRLHLIAVVQAHARLPVGNENDGIAERTKRYLNGRLVGNHDGPVGQSVGTDGAQNDCAQGRFQDRSSGGQGIGRGTGRRGYNQAIRPVGAKIIVANIGLQIDDAAARAFGDHGVVENSKFAQFTILRVDPDLQSHALFNFVISLQSFCQDGLQFVHCYFRDKAEAAQIHTENGDIGPLHQRRDVEQGSIAAQRDDQIGFGRQLLLGAGDAGAADHTVFHQNFLSPLLEPRRQPTHHFGSLGFLVFCHQTNDANHRNCFSCARLHKGLKNVHDGVYFRSGRQPPMEALLSCGAPTFAAKRRVSADANSDNPLASRARLKQSRWRPLPDTETSESSYSSDNRCRRRRSAPKRTRHECSSPADTM